MSLLQRPQHVTEDLLLDFGFYVNRPQKLFPGSLSPGVMSEIIQESPGNLDELSYDSGTEQGFVLVKEV